MERLLRLGKSALAQGHVANKWYFLAKSSAQSPTFPTTLFLLACAKKQSYLFKEKESTFRPSTAFCFVVVFKDCIYLFITDTERGRDIGRGRSKLPVGSLLLPLFMSLPLSVCLS